MAGGKKLTGALLDAYKRVERDLALLHGGLYFTEDQWIQIDYIIHQGQYVFTNGPPRERDNDLIDFFAPLDGPNKRNQKIPETAVRHHDVDLLLSPEPREAKSTDDMVQDSDDTAVAEHTTTSSYHNFEHSKRETAIVSQTTAAGTANVGPHSYNYPSALDGPWRPGEEVHATLTALKTAPAKSKIHMHIDAGDVIRINKNVSKHIFIGKNLRTGSYGQFHEEVFHIGDRASVEARLAGLRASPATSTMSMQTKTKEKTAWVDTPEVKDVKDKAQSEADVLREKQRRRQEAENHEFYSALAWERDEDHLEAPKSRLTAIRTSPRASSLMDSGVDSPTFRYNSPAPSAPVSSEAAEVIAAMRSEFDASIESKVQKLIEALKPSKPNTPSHTTDLDPRVCYYWATPGKYCKHGSNCHKFHYFPDAETSSRYQRPQKVGQVNSKWISQMDGKSNIISTEKQLTCYFWTTKKGCSLSEEMCKFSHRDTGEIAPKPFWCSERGEEEDEGHESSTSEEEEHVDTSLPVDLAVDLAISGSDNEGDGDGEESKAETVHASMDVELGGGDDEDEEEENDNEKQDQEQEDNLISTGTDWDWPRAAADKTAVEASENKTMILGAAAGGWGDESIEVANDDGWNTVPSKKKGGKNDKVVW